MFIPFGALCIIEAGDTLEALDKLMFINETISILIDLLDDFVKLFLV
jgi:hypothetical protein